MADDYYLDAPGLALLEAERRLIHDLAAEAAARFGTECTMVNIGVALGGTLWCLRAGAAQARIIGVDVDKSSARGPWEFHHADSRRFHCEVGAPVHLLLVDGDHDYYAVRLDIENWTPKVPPGGIVIFHDYDQPTQPHTAGVRLAVDEGMDNAEWEIAGTADSIKAFRRRWKYGDLKY